MTGRLCTNLGTYIDRTGCRTCTINSPSRSTWTVLMSSPVIKLNLPPPEEYRKRKVALVSGKKCFSLAFTD
jgi:hypothetical protein